VAKIRKNSQKLDFLEKSNTVCNVFYDLKNVKIAEKSLKVCHF
jgi:hypothetical protein